MTAAAETRAEQWAATARTYGLEADVRVDHTEATLYRNGEVMLPASTFAWVTIREPGILGDTLYGGWRTNHPATGHRAGTRWVNGHLNVPLAKRPDRKFASERDFAARVHLYSYRTAAEARR